MALSFLAIHHDSQEGSDPVHPEAHAAPIERRHYRRISPILENIADYIAYDPETGFLCWTRDPGYKRRAGKQAGFVDRQGYVSVRFCGRSIGGHRVAWRLFYGEWPSGLIDHINGDPADNRIANLRLADFSENAANCRKSRGLLPKGVFLTENGRYRARVRFRNKVYNVGTFDTADEASAAYARMAIEVQGPFARLS